MATRVSASTEAVSSRITVRIGYVVPIDRELLPETGQSTTDAFGSARDYAVTLDLPRESAQGLASRRLWPSLIGLVAFMMFVQAGSAQVQNEPILMSPFN